MLALSTSAIFVLYSGDQDWW